MRPHLAEAVLEDEAFLLTGGLGNLQQPVHEAIAGRRCAHRRSSPRPYRNPNHPSANKRIRRARTDQQ